MVEETIRWTAVRPGSVVADVTVGTGGHALALGRVAGPEGLVLGLDRDRSALEAARARLEREGGFRFILVHAPFSELCRVATEAGIKSFDVILADLGLGTHQVDRAERGFSFSREGPLDLRFDPESDAPTAADVVAGLSEAELADVFWRLGEERYSRAIARALCEERRRRPIRTTTELAEIVTRVVGARTGGRWLRIHPATRVLMALRIYVNRELEELDALLAAVPEVLKAGGRAAIQCYHSLESRAVKEAWRRQKGLGLMQELKGSPVKPSEAEAAANRRVRSVQMRVAERLAPSRAGMRRHP